jgi:hypothetical protein
MSLSTEGGSLSTKENEQKVGSIEVTLSDGTARTFESEVWQEMLNQITEHCAEYFKNGPEPERLAYEAFLSTGQGILNPSSGSAS